MTKTNSNTTPAPNQEKTTATQSSTGNNNINAVNSSITVHNFIFYHGQTKRMLQSHGDDIILPKTQLLELLNELILFLGDSEEVPA